MLDGSSVCVSWLFWMFTEGGVTDASTSSSRAVPDRSDSTSCPPVSLPLESTFQFPFPSLSPSLHNTPPTSRKNKRDPVQLKSYQEVRCGFIDGCCDRRKVRREDRCASSSSSSSSCRAVASSALQRSHRRRRPRPPTPLRQLASSVCHQLLPQRATLPIDSHRSVQKSGRISTAIAGPGSLLLRRTLLGRRRLPYRTTPQPLMVVVATILSRIRSPMTGS